MVIVKNQCNRIKYCIRLMKVFWSKWTCFRESALAIFTDITCSFPVNHRWNTGDVHVIVFIPGMIFDFDFATAEWTLWIFRIDIIKSLLAIWLLLVMIRVTKLILTWRFFTELKYKGIKNEQKRIVNGDEPFMVLFCSF